MIKMAKKKHFTLLLVGLLLVLSTAFLVHYSQAPKKPSRANEASYIIFIDGVTVNAVNGETGRTDYLGTDASSVIQAAIDSLGPSGGIIWIKEGTYVISSTVKVSGNVTLSGVGFATKLVLADFADQKVIANKHAEDYVDRNIVITNLQIDGNGAKQTPEAQVSAVFLSRVSRSRVEGCWIHNVAPLSTNAGVYALYCAYLTIRGNVIYDNFYAGIFLSGGINGIISDNMFYNNHRAVYLAGHLNGVVEGNHIVSGREGVRMYVSASNNVIEGNLIKDNSEEGIAITHPECKNNMLLGNKLVNNVVQIFDGGTDTIIRHNDGYQTENQGVANVANGTYIPHGLAVTPTSVQLTPTAQRIVACLFKNSTHIQVGLWFLDGNAVAESEDVYWHAEF